MFIHSVFHSKDMICYLSLLLVNSGRFQFQLTSFVFTAVLLVGLMVIKHGCHMFLARTGNLEGDVFFSYSWRSPNGLTMPPTLFKASNITSI